MMHTELSLAPLAPPRSIGISPLQNIAIAPGGGGGATVVWLRGEHDVASVAGLTRALAVAAAGSDDDLVVDLSEVTFMDASTIGAIVRARNILRSRSRHLFLRSPSRTTARLLAICGLTGLVLGPSPRPTALATWVAVPQVVAAGQR